MMTMNRHQDYTFRKRLKYLKTVGLELANLLFAGRTGVLHIIEGVDATWYAGTAPKTESTVNEIILT